MSRGAAAAWRSSPPNRLTSQAFRDLRGDRLRMWRCAPRRPPSRLHGERLASPRQSHSRPQSLRARNTSMASTRLLLLVTSSSRSRTLAVAARLAIPRRPRQVRRDPIGDASRTTAARRQNQLRGSSSEPSPSVRLLMPAGATVLVIESDESTQRLLQQTLRSRYTVLMASCWSQACEIRGRAAVDAMVVNVNLTVRRTAWSGRVVCRSRQDALRVGGRSALMGRHSLTRERGGRHCSRSDRSSWASCRTP